MAVFSKWLLVRTLVVSSICGGISAQDASAREGSGSRSAWAPNTLVATEHVLGARGGFGVGVAPNESMATAVEIEVYWRYSRFEVGVGPQFQVNWTDRSYEFHPQITVSLAMFRLMSGVVATRTGMQFRSGAPVTTRRVLRHVAVDWRFRHLTTSVFVRRFGYDAWRWTSLGLGISSGYASSLSNIRAGLSRGVAVVAWPVRMVSGLATR